jgi:DNA-binding transcriptional MerR regulator
MKFTGVQGGQGAVSLGGVLNMTGNYLDVNPIVETAAHPVPSGIVNGVARKRFGSRGVKHTDAYEYNRKPPGLYLQSKFNIDVGNRGDGSVLGYGPRSHMYNVETDISEAQAIAQREPTSHFVREEHVRYVDRTTLTLKERLIDMGEDYQRARIKHLMDQGFTEDEVKAKLDKERERAIEKAEKMPYNKEALMAAQIAQMLPDEKREDFKGTSVAPGGIPALRDEPAIERATNTGTVVDRKKKYQALNREMLIRGEISRVQAPLESFFPKAAKPADLIPEVARETAVQHQKMIQADEDEIAAQRSAERQEREIAASVSKVMGISTESYPADVLKAQKTQAFGGKLPLAHPRSGVQLIKGEGGPSGFIRTGKVASLSKSMEQFGALGKINEKYALV